VILFFSPFLGVEDYDLADAKTERETEAEETSHLRLVRESE
jgi:hypothetical protein